MSSELPPISVTGDVISDMRYEIKIPIPSTRTYDIKAWVHLHPEGWRIAYPSRQVNNIYFDTFSHSNFNDNLSGVSDRTKLRIRWYGSDIDLMENAQIESKHKRGTIGWKRIIHIPGSVQIDGNDWHQIKNTLENRIESASILLQRYPVPIIISSYYREYYTSPDEKLRLTIDTDLTAYDQQNSMVPNIKYPTLPQPYTVVEVKAHPDNLDNLVRALSYSTSQITRFSKYVHAVTNSSTQ